MIRIAALGVAFYFLSFYLDNLWRSAESLMFFAPEGVDVETHKVRLYTFASQTMRALYVLTIAWLLTWSLRFFRGQVLTATMAAAAIFWILAVAETFSVLQYVLCKMVGDGYTMEMLSRLKEIHGESSACDRFAGPGMTWGPPVVTTLALAWVCWRAYQIWRNPPQIPNSTPG